MSRRNAKVPEAGYPPVLPLTRAQEIERHRAAIACLERTVALSVAIMAAHRRDLAALTHADSITHRPGWRVIEGGAATD